MKLIAKLSQTTLLLASLGLTCGHASALDLAAPQANDLDSHSAGQLFAAPVTPSLLAAEQVRLHQTVAVSWPLKGEVNLSTTPHLSQSREAYRKVTGRELNAGIALHTSAPRALVRLQALGEVGQREKDALAPKFFQLKNKEGRSWANGDGMEAIVTADKVAKADLPFSSGTTMFRVHPDVGSGALQLQANGLADEQEYLLNIVEPNSPYQLTLQSQSAHYLHGQELVVRAQLLGANKGHTTKFIQAELVAPDGHTIPVQFKAQRGNAYEARVKLDASQLATNSAPGLWEVRLHLDAQIGAQTVQRSVRTAFPVALPVARLAGSAQVATMANGGLALNFAVESASSGRYEVRGLLYGTQHGKLIPLGVAHAAQWLEAGKGELQLSFDSALLQNASAPYEVRDLSLLDQTRMALLHKQAHGLQISANDMRKADVVEKSLVAKTNSVFLVAPEKALK